MRESFSCSWEILCEYSHDFFHATKQKNYSAKLIFFVFHFRLVVPVGDGLNCKICIIERINSRQEEIEGV